MSMTLPALHNSINQPYVLTSMKTRREMERLGSWLLTTLSTLALEEIDTELLVNYIRSRSVFKAKGTVSDVESKLRCFGVWLGGILEEESAAVAEGSEDESVTRIAGIQLRSSM